MASSIFQRTVVDEQGNIVTGAVVEVRNELTDELAPIFVDRPLAEVKANPFTTDSTGFIKFFVGRGEYRIKATFSDNEIIWRFVQMLDTDYLVNLDVEQTLENKTFIEPVIQTISNTGLLSLPTATDTLVGKATTDTLTNKTLTSPTINGGTVTGITDLAVADGGTGRSTLTANNVLIGNGTSAVNFVAPGAADNVLKSNGTQWVSGPFTATGAGNFTTLSYTDTFTGGTGVVNIGSGQIFKDGGGSLGLGTIPAAFFHASKAFGISTYSELARFESKSSDSGAKLTFHGKQGSDATTKLSGAIGFKQTQNADSNGQPAFAIETGNNGSIAERFRFAFDGQLFSVIPGGATLLPQFACRAWVNFNGHAGASVRASGNVSSVVRTGNGQYTINFATAMPDANYSIAGQFRALNAGDPGIVAQFGALSVGSFPILAGLRTLSPFESATTDTITLSVFR